ncbi:hypothetical protein TNCV_150331 [Trichonephila clavipes]|nr:hypothetical protein TNCV_150331 [Trichonephila clavipes]
MSVIARQTEEERASSKEKNRQRMTETHAESEAEQHPSRLEDAHLRAHHKVVNQKVVDQREDSRFRQHVLIYTMMELYPYCNAQEFKGETKGMFCTTDKIKLPQLGESQSH